MIQHNNILIKNIYYMLAYACRVHVPVNKHNIIAEKFENIYELLARMLTLEVSAICQQGLCTDYIQYNDNLSLLRGRINFAETIRNRMSQDKKLNCEYDEIATNNLYNQIIKSTMTLLQRDAECSSEYKKKLRKLYESFGDVADIDLGKVRWDCIHYTANTRRYQTAITICQLLYQGKLPATAHDGRAFNKFFKESLIHAIYEKFVLNYYKKEFKGKLSVCAPHIHWYTEGGMRDAVMLPQMRTDVMLSSANNILIIDTKYYSKIFAQNNYGGSQKFHSNNLYQIFTYVQNKKKASPENTSVAGMLLYAQTAQEVLPVADYVLCDTPISIKAVDLNTEFANIQQQLNKIVKDYFNIDPVHPVNPAVF